MRIKFSESKELMMLANITSVLVGKEFCTHGFLLYLLASHCKMRLVLLSFSLSSGSPE